MSCLYHLTRTLSGYICTASLSPPRSHSDGSVIFQTICDKHATSYTKDKESYQSNTRRKKMWRIRNVILFYNKAAYFPMCEAMSILQWIHFDGLKIIPVLARTLSSNYVQHALWLELVCSMPLSSIHRSQIMVAGRRTLTSSYLSVRLRARI